MTKGFPIRAAPRIVLVVVLPAIVSCSAKSTKAGKDGQNVGRKGLTGQKLVDSFDGERQGVAEDVYFLGDCYFNYWNSMKKQPTSYKDIEKMAMKTDQPERMKRNAREKIDFVWNAKFADKPADKIVIVYERNADEDGYRVVVTGDGKLRFLDEAEFKTALKRAKE